MKAEDILISLAALLITFLFLSWMALGNAFILMFLNQDTYVLGMGSGTSMYPTIKPGDYLIIDTTPEKLEQGEIIVFVEYGELVGHRIVTISGDKIVTKGDNNTFFDPPITRKSVVGEVEKIIRDPVSKYIAKIWFLGVERLVEET